MADYDCEWCKKTEQCKYSYTCVECIPQQQLNLTEKLSQNDIENIKKRIEEYKAIDEDLFHGVIMAYQQIIWDYPCDEELEYCRKILES